MAVSVLVVDANVIIGALLKNADTRRMLLDSHSPKLVAPAYIDFEIKRYAGEFAKRLKTSRQKIFNAVSDLFDGAHIGVVPEKEYADLLPQATIISPDEKDAPYFALALFYDCPIWSNDKRLKQQQKVRVFETSDLIRDEMKR